MVGVVKGHQCRNLCCGETWGFTAEVFLLMENRSGKVCVWLVQLKVIGQMLRSQFCGQGVYIVGEIAVTLCILIFHPDVLTRFKDRLSVLSKELKACSKRPGEALVKASSIFVETIQKHVEGERIELILKPKIIIFILLFVELCLHLWVSLILCDSKFSKRILSLKPIIMYCTVYMVKTSSKSDWTKWTMDMHLCTVKTPEIS